MADDVPVFTYDGFYNIKQIHDKKQQRAWLFVTVIIVMIFLCSSLWPQWLQELWYYFWFYTAISYVAIAVIRVLTWIVMFHFGI